VIRNLIALVGMMFVAVAAYAQNAAPPANIIIIDFDRVSRESLVGQDISAQMQSNQLNLENYARDVQQRLGEEQSSLRAQQSILDQETYRQRVTQFQQKMQEEQQKVQELQQLARQAMQQANLEVQRALRPITRSLMEEKSANIVLDKALVAHHASGLDVTTEAISRLDDVMSSYNVNLPNIPNSSGSDGS